MAMGLGFLGRGMWRVRRAAVLHILGAGIGGAAAGFAIGALGTLLSLAAWRVELIVGAAVFAIWQSLTRHPRSLGFPWQVPRRWAYSLPPDLRFFLWGTLLGSGIAILIPYSAFIVLLASEATTGVGLALVSGAVFGVTRGMVAVVLLLRTEARLHPEKLPLLLPSLIAGVRRFNMLWILCGSLLLIVTSTR